MKAVRSAIATFFLIGATAIPSQASASLINDTIAANGSSLNPTSATIGAGVEFIGVHGYLDFDFDAHTLTITSKDSLSGWGGFGSYTFNGFDNAITSLSLVSNTGFIADFITDFSFTSNSITLNMNAGTVTNYGQGDVAVFSINSPSAVPEPSTLALAGLAFAAIGVTRRRKAS